MDAAIADLLMRAGEHKRGGRAKEAAALYLEVLGVLDRALIAQPGSGSLHLNRGNILRELGRQDEAAEAYRAGLLLRPESAEGHTALAMLLHEIGRASEAADAYAEAVRLRPEIAQLHSNFGVALSEAGRDEEAIEAFRRSIQLQPDLADAYVNLSGVLRTRGRLAEAVEAAQTAAGLLPGEAEVKINLGNALLEQGRAEEAIAAYRAAVEQKPSLHAAYSNMLMAMHNRAHDADELFAEHRRWGQRYADPLAGKFEPRTIDHDRNRRLRIGLVSPDFRDHPVGRLVLPLIEGHDRASLEMICYSDAVKRDVVSTHLRAAAAEWHDVAGLGDAELAERVRRDRIDILIDLAGHTAGNRLLAFARRPAPVQIAWLGYPDTTGMTQIDYRMTDGVADPPGRADQLHTEKLIRLPGCFLCVRLLADQIASSPARSDDFTFACFNNFTKVSPQSLRMWAAILQAVPRSRLILKSRGLADARTLEDVRSVLATHNLPLERVQLLGHLPDPAASLALYNAVDLALDTYPYSGTATTCDALSMGVPVLTLAGDIHASRVTASLLTAAGLHRWIAHTGADYIDLAAAATRAGKRSTEQRHALRRTNAASPLCDERLFVEGFERALRQAAGVHIP